MTSGVKSSTPKVFSEMSNKSSVDFLSSSSLTKSDDDVERLLYNFLHNLHTKGMLILPVDTPMREFKLSKTTVLSDFQQNLIASIIAEMPRNSKLRGLDPKIFLKVLQKHTAVRRT